MAASVASVVDARTRFFDAARAALGAPQTMKLVAAGPRGPRPDLQRVIARPLTLKGRACLSLTFHHRTKDVTQNLPVEAGLAALGELIDTRFDNLHLVTERGELQLAISRKGKATLRRSDKPGTSGASGASGASSAPDAPGASGPAAASGTQPVLAAPVSGTASHDRLKRRPIDLNAPWLMALGVTDAQQRLVPAMARKWKQINRFVELLDDALQRADLLHDVPRDRPLQVLDVGCGKGYLTFAVHDHLRRAHAGPLRVTGIDLKDDMVALGNATAAAAALDGLAFEHGDVSQAAGRPCDVLIALHACDTATDHAMHAGIRAGARIIMCSPCCHQQLRPQLRSPLLLLPLLRHGVHLGQEAEMLTDGLRALLLEAEGYDTQVFEFTSLEHTQKNKMVLAVRRAGAPDAAQAAARRAQVVELKAFYGVQEQCLETLIDRDRLRCAEAVSPDAVRLDPASPDAVSPTP